MTMSEGALTRYFDLPPGKWRINSTMPGFKVVAVAMEGLRRRLFPLRRVEASEFTALVAFDDKNGEPIEPAGHAARRAEDVLLLRPDPLSVAGPAACLAVATGLCAARGNPYPQRLWRVHRLLTSITGDPQQGLHAGYQALRVCGTQGVWGRDTHAKRGARARDCIGPDAGVALDARDMPDKPDKCPSLSSLSGHKGTDKPDGQDTHL